MGNCWLVASFAAVAEFPCFIQNHVFATNQSSSRGYTIEASSVKLGNLEREHPRKQIQICRDVSWIFESLLDFLTFFLAKTQPQNGLLCFCSQTCHWSLDHKDPLFLTFLNPSELGPRISQEGKYQLRLFDWTVKEWKSVASSEVFRLLSPLGPKGPNGFLVVFSWKFPLGKGPFVFGFGWVHLREMGKECVGNMAFFQLFAKFEWRNWMVFLYWPLLNWML